MESEGQGGTAWLLSPPVAPCSHLYERIHGSVGTAERLPGYRVQSGAAPHLIHISARPLCLSRRRSTLGFTALVTCCKN